MFNHLPESLLLASILAEQCMRHQEGLPVRMTGQRPPETYPITIKPKTASHMAELFLILLLSAQVPFSNSLLLCQHISPQTILFQLLDNSPLLGPWRRSPFPTIGNHEGTIFFLLRLTSQSLRVLQDQLTCRQAQSSSCNWDRFVPGLPDMANLSECPNQVRNKRLFLTPSTSPLFSTPPILSYFFLCPSPR